MSGSSRIHSESDTNKLELPVFINPGTLAFALNRRRSLLTIFNPYQSDAKFKIILSNPHRFDVSLLKGTVESQRRIDITVRLLDHALSGLPEPTNEQIVIDNLKLFLKVGQITGCKGIDVHWCEEIEEKDCDDSSTSSKLKTRHKQLNLEERHRIAQKTSHLSDQRTLPNNVSGHDTSIVHRDSSSINMVCTIGAVACVLILFLPLSLDLDLSKKNSDQQSCSHPSNMWSFLKSFMSISYEMKLGCSFALGLFTYRIISTIPK